MRMFARMCSIGIGAALTWPQPACAQAREGAVPVATVVAREHTLRQTMEVTGGVTAMKTVTVYSKVTGVIEDLPIERGMRLEKGSVIAVVEHRSESAQRKELAAAVQAAEVGVRQAEAAVAVAEARLAQADAQLEEAGLQKERIERLLAEKTVPKRTYDATMARYKVAVAGRDLAAASLQAAREAVARAQVGLTEAGAALDTLDVRIAEYTIRAPIAGVVTARYVDEGAMDSPTRPIAQIMDTSILKIACDVAQVDAGRVREGQHAAITVDAYPGAEFSGAVEIVDPALDPKTRTLRIEIHVAGDGTGGVDPPVRLRPGMFVRVRLLVGEKTTLAVPRDALLRLPGTGVYYAFVVKGGRAEKRALEVGISSGNLVEVLRGLRVGEKLVVKGLGNLRTGTPVVEAKG